MTSKSYWARRMKMLKEGIAQDRAKDVEYIDRQYNKAIKEIDQKIRAWYQRIADNNGVSYAEAQRMLSKGELKDFRMSIEEYIEKGLSGGFEKELENASARVHISRLEALEMELQAHAEELTGKRIARTESALKDAYTEMYYHTGYEVQQMAGVGVNMRKVDKKRLENVLARPWAADEQTFTARCWTDKQRLVHKLETELTRMVATGAAPDKAIKNISDAFNTSKTNARRLVLTESAAMASVAEQDCYKELDVEEYEIVGTFDANMCSDCASLDGEHFPRKDFKIGVNAPPFHPNCYCTTVPYYDDMAGIGERWMRNPETGKGEWIPSDMSYQDWKDVYVDKKYTLDDWKKSHKGLTNTSQGSTISQRDYDIEFAKAVGKTHYDAIYDKVEACANKDAAAVWNRNQEYIEVATTTHRGTQFHRSGKLYLNISNEAVGSYYEAPYQVTFHESGHCIDYLDAQKAKPYGRMFSHEYKDGVFARTIEDEVADIVNQKAAELKKAFAEHIGDRDWFVSQKYMYSWERDIPKYSKKFAYKEVEKELRTLQKIERADLSDMFEGATKAKIQAGFGHGAKYWRDRMGVDGKNNGLAAEAFAEMFSATMTNAESLAAIKKYLPKSYDIFCEMLKAILA